MQITALKADIMGFEGPRDGGNAGPLYGKDHIQQVGDRIHLDVTPTPDSGDPADPNLLRPGQGKSPKVIWRWGRYDKNGNKVFNSKGGDGQLYAHQDEPDHFDLQSYERKNDSDTSGPGLTPVLLQEQAFGPGTVKCFAFACIEKAQNEGLDVESNVVEWLAD